MHVAGPKYHTAEIRWKNEFLLTYKTEIKLSQFLNSKYPQPCTSSPVKSFLNTLDCVSTFLNTVSM